jgi:hypothetical protein
MYKIFKDNMRGVLAVACCAIVIAYGRVEGMDESANGIVIDKVSRKADSNDVASTYKMKESHASTAFGNFECFLCNKRSVLASWPTQLNDLSDAVKFFISDHSQSDLQQVYGSLCYLCLSAFDDFALFCASNYFDDRSRAVTLDLFKLLTVVLSTLPFNSNIKQIADEFSEFYSNISSRSMFILHEQKERFRRIGEVLISQDGMGFM